MNTQTQQSKDCETSVVRYQLQRISLECFSLSTTAEQFSHSSAFEQWPFVGELFEPQKKPKCSIHRDAHNTLGHMSLARRVSCCDMI